MTIRIDGTVTRGELNLRLDLEVGPGITMISGPNGAGKTTLLRLVAGLERLDRGTLHHADRLVDGPGADVFVPAHERAVAMAFQDHRLLPHLTVLDNIAFPLRRRGMRRDEARDAARPHAHALGLDGLDTARPARLSTGQRQRAALARALATPADIVLLDEPLASIDETGKPDIRRHLRELDRAVVLWVTHDPDDVIPGTPHISFDRRGVRQTRTR